MQVWNVLHAARWKYRMQKWCKKSPSAHHRTTLSGYIFATEARIDNPKRVNFGLLADEIVSLVWGIPANFNEWVGFPKCSAPPSGETVPQTQKFWRCKNVLEVLYHQAKFGGARISPAAEAAKNVEFLFVCLSVCLSVLRHAFIYNFIHHYW